MIACAPAGLLMDSHEEVLFVYLGDSLPRYARASLELASEFSGLGVHLIGSAKFEPFAHRAKARFTAIEDFYDPSEAAGAFHRLEFSHSFRAGFWLRALERLFVLEQYMAREGLDSAFHAELDQLLFRTDILVSRLRTLPERGLFLPFHHSSAAVASVLYCNSRSVLRELLQAAGDGDKFPNEMALIAGWAESTPNRVHALPTLASLIISGSPMLPSGVQPVSATALGGVVDAAQLGQWVAGIDPRNVPIGERPRTKFADAPSPALLSRTQLAHLQFSFSRAQGTLMCRYAESNTVQLFNLHIHAKIHRSLTRSADALERLFQDANSPSAATLPGTRWMQIADYMRRAAQFVGQDPLRAPVRLLRHLTRR